MPLKRQNLNGALRAPGSFGIHPSDDRGAGRSRPGLKLVQDAALTCREGNAGAASRAPLGHRFAPERARGAPGRLGFAGKTGSGAEVAGWVAPGEWEKIKAYCMDDVRLTRGIYERMKEYGMSESGE